MPKKAATPKQEAARIAAGLPAKGRLLASLDSLTKEQRARAGITDEDAAKMVSSNQPRKTGTEVEESLFQASAERDVEPQVRVIDHDENTVLFSGSKEQYAKLKKAINGK
jgi:hypothetical protein